MPRSRSPDSIKAEEMYKKGVNLKDIAAEIGKSTSTVRRWKDTQGWENECLAENKEKQKTKEVTDPEVEEVIKNEELTDKQQRFCLYYIKCFNATKAYQKAYGVDYRTAASIAYRLMENPKVRREIQRLKKARLNREMLSEEDIFQKYMDIAFSNITDYVTFGKGSAEESPNFIDLKDSSQVDGSLISEISVSRNGAKVKLLDQMKAMDWLVQHMEMEKAETEDDGFIDALKAEVTDVWTEE